MALRWVSLVSMSLDMNRRNAANMDAARNSCHPKVPYHLRTNRSAEASKRSSRRTGSTLVPPLRCTAVASGARPTRQPAFRARSCQSVSSRVEEEPLVKDPDSVDRSASQQQHGAAHKPPAAETVGGADHS